MSMIYSKFLLTRSGGEVGSETIVSAGGDSTVEINVCWRQFPVIQKLGEDQLSQTKLSLLLRTK